VSELRYQFLNWRPDLEDTQHDGLSVADNVFHDVEGYKQVSFVTDAAVSTMVSSSNEATLRAFQVRQIGNLMDVSNNNKVISYIREEGSGSDLVVDFLNTTTAASTTMGTYTGPSLRAFQTAELNGYVFVCAVADASLTGGGTTTVSISGYTSTDT
jgi:hypothetical protein